MLLAHIRNNFEAAFYPRMSEWFAAGVTLGGGIVFSLNTELMITAPRGYGAMLVWMDQSSWGMLMCLIGSVRLIILLVNGAIEKSPWLRAGAAFISCALWAVLFQSFLPVYGMGMIMSAGYLGMDYMNIVRAMGDARQVDDALRGRHAGTIRSNN